MRRYMSRRGADVRYGRLLAGRFKMHGLVEIAAAGRIERWRGGSTGARLIQANFLQVRDGLMAAGLVERQQFETDLRQLDDPAVLFPSPIMWTVRGRMPADEGHLAP